MKKYIAAALCLLLLVSCGEAATETASVTKTDADPGHTGEITYYVSPNGSDVAAGTREAPFATLSAAAVNAAKSSFAHADIVLLPGVYDVSVPISLPAALTNDRSVSIIGEDGAILSGSVTISPSDFYAPDDDVSARFKDEAKEHIAAVDLTKHGFDASAGFGNIHPYINGKPLDIAQYPDKDARMMKIRSAGTEDEIIWTLELSAAVSKELSSWASMDGVELFGYPKYYWAPVSTPVLSFDAEAALITVDLNDYGAEEKNEICFRNAPEALTADGEYYISPDGIMYMYVPDDFDSAVITIPALDGTILKFTSQKDLTIDNITFTGTRNADDGTAIRFSDCEDVTVKNCTVYETVRGITGSGSGIFIENNHLRNLREGAINVTGGDKATLTPSGNSITNNLIHDWAENGFAYRPAISVTDVGAVISHNEMYSSRHMACGINGNNNIFEYNIIHDVLSYTNDAGAIYSGRTYVNCGNIFRYNWIYNCGKSSIANEVIVGIYFDDCLAGQTAYGNIIGSIVGNGFLVGGGPNNTVTGNLLYTCANNSICYDARGYDGYFAGGWFNNVIEHTFKGESQIKKYDNPVWREAFPWLFEKVVSDTPSPDDPLWLGAPGGAVVKDNLYLIKFGTNDHSTYVKAEEGTQLKYYVHDAVRNFSEVGDMNYLVVPNDVPLTLEGIAALDLPEYISIPFSEIGRK